MSASRLLRNHNAKCPEFRRRSYREITENTVWWSVLYEWTWRSDFEVIYCSSMLGHALQQDRWLWPQFWKCSDGFQLALGNAASCRSQYWFLRLPPGFPAEGPIVSVLGSHRKHHWRMGCRKPLAVAGGLAGWALQWARSRSAAGPAMHIA